MKEYHDGPIPCHYLTIQTKKEAALIYSAFSSL